MASYLRVTQSAVIYAKQCILYTVDGYNTTTQTGTVVVYDSASTTVSPTTTLALSVNESNQKHFHGIYMWNGIYVSLTNITEASIEFG